MRAKTHSYDGTKDLDAGDRDEQSEEHHGEEKVLVDPGREVSRLGRTKGGRGRDGWLVSHPHLQRPPHGFPDSQNPKPTWRTGW
jgi:hypothetical protein